MNSGVVVTDCGIKYFFRQCRLASVMGGSSIELDRCRTESSMTLTPRFIAVGQGVENTGTVLTVSLWILDGGKTVETVKMSETALTPR